MLFVCTANICRSPYLELTARALAGDGSDVEFSSAGTHGFDAQPMNEPMVATLAAARPSGFASRRLTREILADADLVLTAEATHRDLHPGGVPPALPQGLHRRASSLPTIAEHPDLTGRELVAAAAARRTAARPEHDIADPYRRGESAALAAADTMTSMLSVIVPRLVGDR